jgi:hypothetical protein
LYKNPYIYIFHWIRLQSIQKVPLISAKDDRIVLEQHSMERYVNEQILIHNMLRMIDKEAMDNVLQLML